MRSFILGAAISLAALTAPANAATFMNVGDTATLDFVGLVEGDPLPGLSGTLNLTLDKIEGNEWTFDFVLSNTSTAPVTASRISAFGFNSNPDFDSAEIVSGSVFDGVSDGNVPGLPFNVEFCATAGPNCSGGGGDGVFLGGSASGSFLLKFATELQSVAFSDYYVRYQSIDAPGIRGGSGVGVVPGAIPEPASWAMMIAGFGLVGASMRRRRGMAVTTA